MGKYLEKRPEFEAVQLVPSNAEELKKMTDNDVGFSDTCCYIRLRNFTNNRLYERAIGHWLVKPPTGDLMLCSNQEFEEQFEKSRVLPGDSSMPFKEFNDDAGTAYRLREDAIKELCEAIRLTVEYVGINVLPPLPGWSWYEALVKYDPETAATLHKGI